MGVAGSGAVRIEILSFGEKSVAARCEKFDWEETHLELAKKAAGVALVECMQVSKVKEQNLGFSGEAAVFVPEKLRHTGSGARC